MRWRASWPTSSRPRSASRSSSTIAAAPPASSACAWRRKAAPDGYTLVLAHTGSTSINPSLYANPGYDPRNDFAPIGLIASTPIVLMAHPSFRRKVDRRADRPGQEGARQDQFRHAAARHRRLSRGRTVQVDGRRRHDHHSLQGHRGAHHRSPRRARAGRLQRDRARDGQPAAGGLRAIAMAGPTRIEPVPRRADRERVRACRASRRCCTTACWRRPARPRTIIARLNTELRELVAAPDVRERIAADGGDPLPSSPQEYAADIDREEAKWSALIKKLNLRVE